MLRTHKWLFPPDLSSELQTGTPKHPLVTCTGMSLRSCKFTFQSPLIPPPAPHQTCSPASGPWLTIHPAGRTKHPGAILTPPAFHVVYSAPVTAPEPVHTAVTSGHDHLSPYMLHDYRGTASASPPGHPLCPPIHCPPVLLIQFTVQATVHTA